MTLPLLAFYQVTGKNLLRDPMLRWMLLVPLFYTLLVRFGAPLFCTWVESHYQIEASPYFPLVVSFFVLSMLALVGIVIGFLILDEKDDQILLALQVTPLPPYSYVTYHLLLPLLLSVALSFFLVPLLGVFPISLSHLVLLTLSFSPIAPLYTLLLGIFAKNKIQGFALLKSVGTGVFFIGPAIAYFTPFPWHFFFAVLPTYWPLKFFWALVANEPGSWVYFLGNLLYSGSLLYYFSKHFYRLTR